MIEKAPERRGVYKDMVVSLERDGLSHAKIKDAADQRREWRSGTDTPTLNGDVIPEY